MLLKLSTLSTHDHTFLLERLLLSFLSFHTLLLLFNGVIQVYIWLYLYRYISDCVLHGWRSLVGFRRVWHNWATSLSLFTFMHWRRKWQPIPVFLPGESQGQGSLVGCRLWGHTVRHDWSDLAAAAAESTFLTFWSLRFLILKQGEIMLTIWFPVSNKSILKVLNSCWHRSYIITISSSTPRPPPPSDTISIFTSIVIVTSIVL